MTTIEMRKENKNRTSDRCENIDSALARIYTQSTPTGKINEWCRYS